MHSPSLKEIKIVFKNGSTIQSLNTKVLLLKIAQKKGFSFKIFEKHQKKKKQLKQEQENIQS